MTLLVDTPIFTRPADMRLAARNGSFSSPTPGQCAGYVQVNLLILPKQYADHFRELCRRNPVPCPLIAESTAPGDVTFPPGVAEGIDVTTDSPGYNVYVGYYDGKLVHHDVKDVRKYWKEDSVAFLIGCSLTFEAALRDAGLTPRHSLLGTNVTMYRTSLRLLPGGIFGGNMVVSMRPYKAADVERVRDITRPFGRTHGEPIAWGWDAVRELGIADIDKADFGDSPVFEDGEVPVFWGCGVSPQQSVMDSPLVKGWVIGHTPGKMICLDIKEADIRTSTSSSSL